jgi:hypothetical protein
MQKRRRRCRPGRWLLSTGPEMRLRDAARLFLTAPVRDLPRDGRPVGLVQQWHAKTCAIPRRLDPRRWSRNIIGTAQMDLLGVPLARIARRIGLQLTRARAPHNRAAVESRELGLVAAA